LVALRGDEVVFFDARNEFEARIGKFKNAVVPNVRTTATLSVNSTAANTTI